MLLLSSDFSFKINFFENSFRNSVEHYQRVNRLDSDQGHCSVGPYLGPNACKGKQASYVATCTGKKKS